MPSNERDILLLAEKIMGWTIFGNGQRWGPGHFVYPRGIEIADKAVQLWDERHTDGWNPFGSIADAWMIVEKLREKYCFSTDSVGHAPNVWRCMVGWSDDPISVMAESETACGAICAAALKTLTLPAGEEC